MSHSEFLHTHRLCSCSDAEVRDQRCVFVHQVSLQIDDGVCPELAVQALIQPDLEARLQMRKELFGHHKLHTFGTSCVRKVEAGVRSEDVVLISIQKIKFHTADGANDRRNESVNVFFRLQHLELDVLRALIGFINWFHNGGRLVRMIRKQMIVHVNSICAAVEAAAAHVDVMLMSLFDVNSEFGVCVGLEDAVGAMLVTFGVFLYEMKEQVIGKLLPVVGEEAT